jgi:hypothetical protein
MGEDPDDAPEGSIEVHVVFDSRSNFPIAVFTEESVADAVVEHMGKENAWTCPYAVNEGLGNFLTGRKVWDVDFYDSGLVTAELSNEWAGDLGAWFDIEINEEESKEMIRRIRIWAAGQEEALHRASIFKAAVDKVHKKRES